MEAVEDKGRGSLDQQLAEAQGEADTESTSEIAAVGGDYVIGSMTLNITPGRVMLLERINSPFIGEGEGEESEQIAFTLEDIAKALYVIAVGPDALTPIMKVEAQLKRLKTAESLAAKRPEFYDKYMDKIIDVAATEGEFSLNAIKFYEEHMNDQPLEESGEMIMQMIMDAFEPLSMIPDTESKGEGAKKN